MPIFPKFLANLLPVAPPALEALSASEHLGIHGPLACLISAAAASIVGMELAKGSHHEKEARETRSLADLLVKQGGDWRRGLDEFLFSKGVKLDRLPEDARDNPLAQFALLLIGRDDEIKQLLRDSRSLQLSLIQQVLKRQNELASILKPEHFEQFRQIVQEISAGICDVKAGVEVIKTSNQAIKGDTEEAVRLLRASPAFDQVPLVRCFTLGRLLEQSLYSLKEARMACLAPLRLALELWDMSAARKELWDVANSVSGLSSVALAKVERLVRISRNASDTPQHYALFVCATPVYKLWSQILLLAETLSLPAESLKELEAFRYQCFTALRSVVLSVSGRATGSRGPTESDNYNLDSCYLSLCVALGRVWGKKAGSATTCGVCIGRMYGAISCIKALADLCAEANREPDQGATESIWRDAKSSWPQLQDHATAIGLSLSDDVEGSLWGDVVAVSRMAKLTSLVDGYNDRIMTSLACD